MVSMRELTECKAEVFRRSEVRIRERKRVRKHIVMLCIPLCLLMVLGTLMLSPEKNIRGNKSSGAKVDGGVLMESATGSIVCSYTLVEIQWEEETSEDHMECYKKVTDKVKVTKIFCTIHSYFPTADGAEKNGESSIDDNRQNGANSKLEEYKVIFSTEEGCQTIYKICDNEIVNVSTGEMVILTDDQIAKLKVELGIVK